MQILALKCNNNNNDVVDDYDHSYVSNIYIHVYMYICIVFAVVCGWRMVNVEIH